MIEYYRHKEKSQTRLFQLSREFDTLAVSSVVEYEILRGQKNVHDAFWNKFFDSVKVLPFDRKCAQEAAVIYAYLKSLNHHQQPLEFEANNCLYPCFD